MTQYHIDRSTRDGPQSRRLAGIILILVPLVAFGGASLLTQILGGVAGYLDNPLRQDLWRAGHAHAGVLLVLALVLLRYVDETTLSGPRLWLARDGVPLAAILMPVGFFLSVLSPDTTAPNHSFTSSSSAVCSSSVGCSRSASDYSDGRGGPPLSVATDLRAGRAVRPGMRPDLSAGPYGFGSNMPSWRMSPIWSNWCQCSVTLPSRIRKMWISPIV